MNRPSRIYATIDLDAVTWNLENMRKNISEALNINIDQINVKATTEEGLGFTGEGKGISSQSICLLTKKSS